MSCLIVINVNMRILKCIELKFLKNIRTNKIIHPDRIEKKYFNDIQNNTKSTKKVESNNPIGPLNISVI